MTREETELTREEVDREDAAVARGERVPVDVGVVVAVTSLEEEEGGTDADVKDAAGDCEEEMGRGVVVMGAAVRDGEEEEEEVGRGVVVMGAAVRDGEEEEEVDGAVIEGVLRSGELERDGEGGGMTSVVESGIRRKYVELCSCCRVSRTVCVCVCVCVCAHVCVYACGGREGGRKGGRERRVGLVCVQREGGKEGGVGGGRGGGGGGGEEEREGSG